MRSLVLALAVSTVSIASLAPSAARAEPPVHYLGVGARGGLNDSAAAVINAKLKITEQDNPSVSIRPAVLLGDEIEVRLPLTVETSLSEQIFPFLGAGVAYNTDGLNAVDPMVTGGTDVRLLDNLILELEGNLIFQVDADDLDAEFIGTVNYEF